jgi:hypothetical protein
MGGKWQLGDNAAAAEGVRDQTPIFSDKGMHGQVETSFPPTGMVCRFSLIMPETKRA